MKDGNNVRLRKESVVVIYFSRRLRLTFQDILEIVQTSVSDFQGFLGYCSTL
jgi:hypothetical protein